MRGTSILHQFRCEVKYKQTILSRCYYRDLHCFRTVFNLYARMHGACQISNSLPHFVNFILVDNMGNRNNAIL